MIVAVWKLQLTILLMTKHVLGMVSILAKVQCFISPLPHNHQNLEQNLIYCSSFVFLPAGLHLLQAQQMDSKQTRDPLVAPLLI